jgi:hypothetical protein
MNYDERKNVRRPWKQFLEEFLVSLWGFANLGAGSSGDNEWEEFSLAGNQSNTLTEREEAPHLGGNSVRSQIEMVIGRK